MAEPEPSENGTADPEPPTPVPPEADASSDQAPPPTSADPSDTPPDEPTDPSVPSDTPPDPASDPSDTANPSDTPSDEPTDPSVPSDTPPDSASAPSDSSDPSDTLPDVPSDPDADQPLDLSRSTLVQPLATSEEEAEDTEPAAEEVPVDTDALRRTVEALLFAAEAPLTVREIARAAGSRSNVIRKVLANLQEALETDARPWALVEVAGGWRFATRPEYFPAIQKLKVQRSQRRLTPAAMEVLALIAYSQEPIGRAEIEAVRGVDSGPVLRLLLERKLVRIAGRGEGLGQPLLYAVSQEFLEHFGLKSTKELPQTGEFKG